MKRETSAYERVMFYYSGKGPMYFAFRLKIRGKLSADEVRTALEKTRKVYPLTAVRAEKTADGRQFITTDNVPEYPFHVRPGEDQDWHEETVKLLQEPFDNANGPMARFMLLTGGETHTLIAVFHHAVGDGIGAVLFLEDLMNFLGDPDRILVEPNSENWAPMLHENISSENFSRIQTMEKPGYIEDKSYAEYDIKEIEPVVFPRVPFVIHSVSFTEGQTVKTVSLAKNSGVTVHSFLGALLLQSFAEEFGQVQGYSRTIQSPVNFRPQMREGADKMFGLFNGIVKTKCDCSPERSTADIAKEIGTYFRDEMDSLKPLCGYYYFMNDFLKGIRDAEEYFDNRKNNPSPMDYDFSFSNLGRIGMRDNYGGLVLEEIHGPVFSATKGERVIGALTFQGKLFMTMIYDPEEFDREAGMRIWTRFTEKIEFL